MYPSNFKYESRILKETKSLIDSGLVDRIFIAAIWESGLREHEQLDSKREVWRVPLKTRHLPNGRFWKVLKIIEWMIKIFIRFRKVPITLVNCHCLAVLPLGVMFKIFVKSKVIYDAHELETEKNWPGAIKKMAKVLERILICHVDRVIVINNSIAQWYKNKYSLEEIYVVKNVPYKQDINPSNVLRGKFGIQDDEILFIYQGLLDSRVKFLLDVFSKIDNKKHIVFMGCGILEDTVKKYEKNFSNIHFQPAVKPNEVLHYTASADVGINLIENLSLNHYYCLPNKVFEYILSGLPLIVSDFPEMGRLIDDCKCGWKVPVNERLVIELIENISKKDVKEKKNNALNYRQNLGWHKEERKLLQLYKELRSMP